jgi:predicted SnoaL-like aldol condensation-catalyzing enzyme
LFRVENGKIAEHWYVIEAMMPKENWKIIHVHYSSMPATGEREGF